MIVELIGIMESVAAGNYSNDIMEYTRPEHPEPIRRLAEAMGMMMVKVEAREQRLENLVAELEVLNEQLQNNIIKTVCGIANALGARDRYTEGHGERVAEYAVRLARRMGLSEEEVQGILIGGLLHDVGKIGFSDRIFEHIDIRLPDDMREEIQRHPVIGAEIIKDLDFLGGAESYVLFHHERADGTGYPFGLRDEAIPQGARILAVADSFDAMTTDRSYQKGKTRDEAFAILRDLAGRGLSKELVELFIEEVLENGLPVSRERSPGAEAPRIPSDSAR
ncbi:MAG: HD domain-containing protein [Proteobacteria bacterium]|nr:HD domain-containing protein [Pseudomonadota bacterium]